MKKFYRFACALIALVLVLAAAGCDANNAASQGKDEIVIGIPGTISSVDVNQEAGILNYYIGTLTNEGLVHLDNDGKIIPGLAESWDTEDYTVWTFKLRSGAKFHDGSAVTVEDVIWSIERAQDPTKSPGVSIYFPDYGQVIEKVDDSTLKITLDGAHPNFIWALANVGGLLVNKQSWGEGVSAIGSPQDLLMGSGPYKIVEFEPGSHVSLEAQEHWWGTKPEIQKIRMDFITDDVTRLLAFTQGSIDFALDIPVDQSAQWGDVEGATVQFYADRSYYGLTLDPTVAPFDNEHVRKAVAYSMDASSVVASILQGHAQVATAITPPEQFATVMSVDEAKARLGQTAHYDYNIDKAKEEMELSGVEPFETTVFYPASYQDVGKASQVLSEALKEIGITLNVREIPLDQWLSEVGNGEQGIAWMIYFATTAEPGEIASWLLDGGGPGYNPSNFTDEEIASLTYHMMSVPAADGVEELLQAHDLAQGKAYYAPVWWGESAIAWGDKITVTDFNSYTMLSENWTAQFKIK